jgi:hypothetical protein
MGMHQIVALEKMQKRYGKSAFTEDHEYYRRVGCKIGAQTLSCVGNTWQAAMANLTRKVSNGK